MQTPLKGSPSLFAFSFVATLALSSREAQAQTIPSVTGILGAVQRCQPDGTGCSASPDDAGPVNAIDLADCEANLHYQIDLGIANPSGSHSLEAWVGAQDCSQLANRQTSDTSVCWPVASLQSALVSPYALDIRIQDIASGAFTTAHPVTFTPAGPSVCHAQPDAGTTNMTLYMFFVDGNANPVGTVQSYPITLDMSGATAPGATSDAGADGAGPTPSGAAGASSSAGGCSAGGARPVETSGPGAMMLASAVALFRKRKRRGGPVNVSPSGL